MMGLVMLALLAAAPIHAERWTLWARYRSFGVGRVATGPGAATEAECWATFARLHLTGVDADVIRTVVEGHKTTAYYRDGHQVRGRVHVPSRHRGPAWGKGK